VSCTVYSQDDTSERPGLHARADAATAGSVGAPASVRQKSTAELAAEQQAIDELIATQLREQQLTDEQLADQP